MKSRYITKNCAIQAAVPGILRLSFRGRSSFVLGHRRCYTWPMKRKAPLLALVPALCAVLIALIITVLKSGHISDFSFGASVGVLLGISIISIVVQKRKTS